MQLSDRVPHSPTPNVLTSNSRPDLALIPATQQLSHQLDDRKLLHQFVKGEGKPISSPNLQIVQRSNTIQLRTLSNDLIAMLKPSYKIKSALVNHQHPYSKALHQILLSEKLVPCVQPGEEQPFLEYHEYVVPRGYEILYTAAGVLWKTCWTKRRNPIYKFQLDVLVFTQGSFDKSWFPITEIEIYQGKIYLKTLVNKMVLAPTDKIVWLNNFMPSEVNNRKLA